MCAQEAISVGINSATTFDDNIISSYRTHPFVLLRGGDVKSLMGELLGRVCGVSKGKGGSMHVFTEAFQGGHGIVGAQVPLGAGLAFAQKYLGKKTATFAMYGDGASNQGQVFESYNMVRDTLNFCSRHPLTSGIGEALEPALYLRLREQQVRYGYLGGA